MPNAAPQLLPEAGAQRTLEAVRCSAWLDADPIYETALGRLPTESEAQLALEIVGTPATGEGLEDFLWSICMLPEFQLIP